MQHRHSAVAVPARYHRSMARQCGCGGEIEKMRKELGDAAGAAGASVPLGQRDRRMIWVGRPSRPPPPTHPTPTQTPTPRPRDGPVSVCYAVCCVPQAVQKGGRALCPFLKCKGAPQSCSGGWPRASQQLAAPVRAGGLRAAPPRPPPRPRACRIRFCDSTTAPPPPPGHRVQRPAVGRQALVGQDHRVTLAAEVDGKPGEAPLLWDVPGLVTGLVSYSMQRS
jgi:hypothetical protein